MKKKIDKAFWAMFEKEGIVIDVNIDNLTYDCVVCGDTEIHEQCGLTLVDMDTPPGSMKICLSCWNALKKLILTKKENE